MYRWQGLANPLCRILSISVPRIPARDLSLLFSVFLTSFICKDDFELMFVLPLKLNPFVEAIVQAKIMSVLTNAFMMPKILSTRLNYSHSRGVWLLSGTYLPPFSDLARDKVKKWWRIQKQRQSKQNRNEWLGTGTRDSSLECHTKYWMPY